VLQPVYKQWIDAISRGDLDTLKSILDDDYEMVVEYESRFEHGLPFAGMRSVHVAAFYGQPTVLQWIEEHSAGALDLVIGDGKTPTYFASVAIKQKHAPSVQELERYVKTFLVLGYARSSREVPEILRLIAAVSWREWQSGHLDAFERGVGMIRALLDMANFTAGSETAVEIGLHVSGLPPFWELLDLAIENGQGTMSLVEHAVQHALRSHPMPNARCFFEFMPSEIAAHIRANPSCLEDAWQSADFDLAKYIIEWTDGGDNKAFSIRQAMSRAVSGQNINAVHAILGLSEPSPTQLPFRYLLWHVALGRFAQLDVQESSGSVYRLCYTPRSLWQAWNEIFPGLSAEDAEDDLLAAVSDAYRVDCLRMFESRNTGYPMSIAFLTTSVIAASRMSSDEGVHAGNYYWRLGDTLGFGLVEPPGFDKPLFRTLWEDVAAWLKPYVALCLPSDRYVSIALSHVLLRQVDINKLDRYFDARRFQPRQRLIGSSIKASFLSWAQKHNLSVPAQQAVKDDRLTAVLDQVATELFRWDGSVREISSTDRLTSRSVTIDFHLDRAFDGRYECLISAQHPPGFPESFSDVLGVSGTSLDFDGFDRYGPLSVTEDSQGFLASMMLDGFGAETNVGGRRLRVLSTSRKAIVFRLPEDDAIWKSAPTLPLNSVSMLMCHSSVEDETVCYLREVCGPEGFRRAHQQILPDWALFTNVVVRNARVTPPPAISDLQPETDVEIRLVGGLRIGRSMDWLDEAPPDVIISGIYGSVLVNSTRVQPTADGRISLATLSLAPGSVRITVDAVTADIGLTEPRRHESTLLLAEQAKCSYFLYPLIPGEWALLGTRPDQILVKRIPRRSSTESAGEVVRLDFPVAWILDLSGPPRVYLAYDRADASDDCGVSGTAIIPPAEEYGVNPAWHAAITSRRDQFRKGRFSQASQKQVQRSWAEFVETASKLASVSQVQAALDGSDESGSVRTQSRYATFKSKNRSSRSKRKR